MDEIVRRGRDLSADVSRLRRYASSSPALAVEVARGEVEALNTLSLFASSAAISRRDDLREGLRGGAASTSFREWAETRDYQKVRLEDLPDDETLAQHLADVKWLQNRAAYLVYLEQGGDPLNGAAEDAYADDARVVPRLVELGQRYGIGEDLIRRIAESRSRIVERETGADESESHPPPNSAYRGYLPSIPPAPTSEGTSSRRLRGLKRLEWGLKWSRHAAIGCGALIAAAAAIAQSPVWAVGAVAATIANFVLGVSHQLVADTVAREEERGEQQTTVVRARVGPPEHAEPEDEVEVGGQSPVERGRLRYHAGSDD